MLNFNIYLKFETTTYLLTYSLTRVKSRDANASKKRDKREKRREKRVKGEKKMSRVNYYKSEFNSKKKKLNILAEILGI